MLSNGYFPRSSEECIFIYAPKRILYSNGAIVSPFLLSCYDRPNAGLTAKGAAGTDCSFIVIRNEPERGAVKSFRVSGGLKKTIRCLESKISMMKGGGGETLHVLLGSFVHARC